MLYETFFLNFYNPSHASCFDFMLRRDLDLEIRDLGTITIHIEKVIHLIRGDFQTISFSYDYY